MNPEPMSSMESDSNAAGRVLRELAAPTADGPVASGFAPYDGQVFLVPGEGRLVVVASGGLWVGNAKSFQHALLAKITNAVRAVDLDLSALVRFDTWALCTLLSLRRYFSARQIPFRLLHPSFRVEMILEMTKTRSLFEVLGSASPRVGGEPAVAVGAVSPAS